MQTILKCSLYNETQLGINGILHLFVSLKLMKTLTREGISFKIIGNVKKMGTQAPCSLNWLSQCQQCPIKKHEIFAPHPPWSLEIKLRKVSNELQMDNKQIQTIAQYIVQVLPQNISFDMNTTSLSVYLYESPCHNFFATVRPHIKFSTKLSFKHIPKTCFWQQ